MASEMMLQYLWEYRLLDYSRCIDVDGQKISIIDPGTRNRDAGPDFFNAKIRIGDRLWAGNVEIHDRASDWHRHGHDIDPAYHTVILHVVADSDCRIPRPDGTILPQFILPVPPAFHDRYAAMNAHAGPTPACAAHLPSVPPILATEWISALGYERLFSRVDRVLQLQGANDDDWTSTAFILLARALGFGTNAEPFEQLARSLPLKILLKHRNDPAMLEAALFGAAGFLDRELPEADGSAESDYLTRLIQNYRFIKAKFSLDIATYPAWRTARMRPPNFPQRRIAALAAILGAGFDFGRDFHQLTTLAAARSFFTDIRLSPYWIDHYDFGCRTAARRVTFTPATIDTILINTLIPLTYARGARRADTSLIDRAVDFLTAMPPESNSVVTSFTRLGISCPDAFTSQALIHLRRAYCEPRKCIYCRFGRHILTS